MFWKEGRGDDFRDAYVWSPGLSRGSWKRGKEKEERKPHSRKNDFCNVIGDKKIP